MNKPLSLALILAITPGLDAVAQINSRTRADTLPLFLEHQVQEAARVLEWKVPEYPGTLKTRKIEGEVLIQFVVDTAGRMESASLRVLRASNAAFESAVRKTLATARFAPAMRNKRRVRQLMQQPFLFRLKN